MTSYDSEAKIARKRLDEISPSMCMAKWLQVSLHLPQGRTHSCYHPPTHVVPLSELRKNIGALHNTQFKMEERRQMLEGKRPAGCQYCWNIEDAPNQPTDGALSDRHYRSSEWWVKEAWQEVAGNPWDHQITPRYVEVNFNQSCNFKCAYCSPHLSSAWEADIRQHGKFMFSDSTAHNDLEGLYAADLMPLDLPTKENPYIDAFWRWFPTIYKDLKIFRMTGGEPLMDKNTFKIFDYVIDNPKPDLELSLTSNLCPPSDDLFDTFIDKLQKIEEDRSDAPVYIKGGPFRLENYKSEDNRVMLIYVEDQKDGSHWSTWPQRIVKESLGKFNPAQLNSDRQPIEWSAIRQSFTTLGKCNDKDDNSFIYESNDIFYSKSKVSLYVSLDSVGAQAEYIRDGLDYERLRENIYTVLSNTRHVSLNIINTFNILSIDGLQDFLKFILELRRTFNHRNTFQTIWFDIPYLRNPPWMSIQLADERLLRKIEDCIEFMKANTYGLDNWKNRYLGFKDYEVLKLQRNLEWAREGAKMKDDDRDLLMVKFRQYFIEYDRRRQKSFLATFPEMDGFWSQARIKEVLYAMEIKEHKPSFHEPRWYEID